MYKKLIFSLILCIFFLGIVSAFEWDNVKIYDSKTKTATIKNAFGIGEKIADIPLKTEQHMQVGLGYQEVFRYEINSYKEYKDFIQETEIYNLKKGGLKENKNIDLKYVTYKDVEVNDYGKEICSEKEKDMFGNPLCKREVIGKHIEQREVLNDLSSMDVKAEKIIISGWTTVNQGDYYEWIPNFAGIKVEEWATWSGNLFTNMMAYYPLSETTGPANDSLGVYNSTSVTAVQNRLGKLGQAYWFNGTSKGGTVRTSLTYDDIPLSLSMWIYYNGTTGVSNYIFSNENGGYDFGLFITTADNITINTGNSTYTTNTTIKSGQWTHLALSINSTGYTVLYVNNTAIVSPRISYASSGTVWHISGADSNTNTHFNGTIDEVAIWNRSITATEVALLYNSGVGCAYENESCYTPTDYPPTITLNSPVNYFNSSSQSITFNCTATDDIQVNNVSLYINSSINETNSSGFNNTIYSFTKSISEGFYNWTCGTCDINLTQNATDYKGLNNGTLVNGAVIWKNASAVGNGGAYFDGVDDYVNTTYSNYNENQTFGVSFWIRSNGFIYNSGNSGNAFSLKYGYFGIRAYNSTNDYMYFRLDNATSASDTRGTGSYIPLNESGVWHHIYINYWTNGIVRYANMSIDNVFSSTTAIMEGFKNNQSGTFIGLKNGYFNGSIDEVMIFNRSLSASEVAELYANQSAGLRAFTDDASLVSYYPFDDGTSQCVNATARALTIDSTYPTILVTGGNGTQSYGNLSSNHTLNYTITDTNIHSCWLNYNGTNMNIPCTTGATNTTNFTLQLGTYNATIWVNDTSGNTQSRFISWDYRFLFANQSYITPILEGVSTDYTMNIYTNGSAITIAYFTYNGTTSYGTITDNGGDFYTISKTQNAQVVSADTNYSFNWIITQGDFGNVTFTSNNQTVTNLGIDNCSVNTKVLYNFTMKDEELQTEINETGSNSLAQLNFQLFNYGTRTIVQELNLEFNQTNPFAICFNNSFGTEKFSADMQLNYQADSYEPEFYHIQNATIQNSSFTTNISLYDLNTSDSQIFKLKVRDSSYQTISDAIVTIYRKYIDEGVYKVVEIPLTDAKGETLAHLVLNDAVYNFVITKYGEVIANYSNVLAICQNPTLYTCTIDFSQTISGPDTTDFADNTDFNNTLTYNETSREVSMTFDIPSGSPKWVTLNVTREDALGTAGCSDYVTSSAGTLSCTVPASFGNESISAKVYVDGSRISGGGIKLDQKAKDIYGGVLVLLSVVVLATIIGVGLSSNPLITVIFIAGGAIVMFAINLISNTGFIGKGATILWFLIICLLILIKGANRN